MIKLNLFGTTFDNIMFYVTLALTVVVMAALVCIFVKVLRQTLKEKRKIDEQLKINRDLAAKRRQDSSNEGFSALESQKTSQKNNITPHQ